MVVDDGEPTLERKTFTRRQLGVDNCAPQERAATTQRADFSARDFSSDNNVPKY